MGGLEQKTACIMSVSLKNPLILNAQKKTHPDGLLCQ